MPFPSTGERFERLEETLQIVRQMWSGDPTPYAGNHYRLEEPINVPPPVQSPPPIMIGGSGEKKTLRLVAEYADACNLFGGTPDEIRHKLDVLRGHCDAVGRDYEAIEKTMIVSSDPTADPDGFLSEMEQFAELGISMVATGPAGDDPVGWTSAVCERVVPRLAEI